MERHMDHQESSSRSETGNAGQAFDALRGEVALLRRAIESLAAQSGTLDIPDYSETLGQMALHMKASARTLKDMAASPALDMTPESLAKQIEAAAQAARASDHAAQTAARKQLDTATADMRQIVSHARTADEQRRHLVWVAGGGLLAGIILWSFLPGMIARSAPTSWHWPESMAARTIGLSMGEAGARMLENANPEQWHDIISAYRLWQDNGQAITQCRKRASKNGKEASCTIRITSESGVKARS